MWGLIVSSGAFRRTDVLIGVSTQYTKLQLLHSGPALVHM